MRKIGWIGVFVGLLILIKMLLQIVTCPTDYGQ
jgi:hypothetical protein